MRYQIKFSVVCCTLLFILLTLFTGITANAQTFGMHIPSFGLYSENQNADINGKVKYVIDENGKAVQYSEYTINGTDDLTLYIPFVSNAYKLPNIDISVNQKAVTKRLKTKSIFTDLPIIAE